MVFQDYALYPFMTVRQNLEFPLEMRRMPRGAIDAARRAGRRQMLELGAAARPAAEAALGRPAPARRHGARPGARAERVAARRAALEPRRQAARRGARRDRRAAAAHRHDHDLRHPRSDRGDDARPPHRRARPAAACSRWRTPRELYERPANAFVAGFIGNPPMNICPRRARAAAPTAALQLTIGDQVAERCRPTPLPGGAERAAQRRAAPGSVCARRSGCKRCGPRGDRRTRRVPRPRDPRARAPRR